MEKDISIYIHIPYCISKCSYCDFFSVPVNNVPDEYVFALCNEISFRLKYFKVQNIKSIYIGGGTPSLLNNVQLKLIVDSILKNNFLTDNYEFTIEVNPDDVTKELLDFYSSLPINRISCGIQSLDDKVLSFVNRRANSKQNLNALELLSKYWNKNFSVDLISALPFEKEKTFFSNIKKIISYNPNHISLYSLTVEQETPLGNQIYKNKIEYDFDKADESWLKGKEILEKNGYLQYEVSNFAKNNCISTHNMSYWKHQNYIGAGSGATGTFYNDDGSGIRWTNKTNLCEYIKKWKTKIDLNTEDTNLIDDLMKKNVDLETVDIKTSMFEFFMMGCRTIEGVSSKDFFDIFKMDIPKKVIDLFTEWEQKGLCMIKKEPKNTIYALNSKGLLFLNNFLTQLNV